MPGRLGFEPRFVVRGRRNSPARTSFSRREVPGLNFILTRSPDEFQALFWALQLPEDVSDLLEVAHRDLNYWIYRTPEPRRYATFHIRKRGGGERRIDAPTTNVKILQQKLNQVLQTVYRSKPSVHGFVAGKSVKSNAEQHVGKKWVFNLDLEDFFPSINFGRVRGMFMGKPYCLPPRVATVLAHLCCHQGRIAQGAPTSPVISNMICAQMDSQLQQLAKTNHSTYTRYADDITFSTTRRKFPNQIAVLDGVNQLRPADALSQIIEQNGFSINNKKVWLSGQHRRQLVTGLTVNEFPNVSRKFTNQIRAMLHAWRKHGLCAAQEHWETKYYKKHRAPWHTPPRFEQVLKGKIEYLGMVRGQDSMAYQKFLDQLGELDPTLTHGRGTPLRLALNNYDALYADPTNPQDRGYLLERILNNLFEASGVLVRDSFRRNAGGEQIDGAIMFDSWFYLVECRWRTRRANPSELDALLGKVGRSGNQAMGMFISVNGWSPHVVTLLKQNRDKSILLLNGNDIRAVLAGEIPLTTLLKHKVEALSLCAEPFVGVDAIVSSAREVRD